MCSQVIDRLKMVFMPKNIANLIMNIACVFLNLSRALYIFECINLSVQDLFLSELLQAMISLAEAKKLVIPFLRIYLFASLLSVHCVYPHWRSHKPRWISTLKTKYHLSWSPPWPQPIVENGSSIQGRLQDGATIKDLKYLSEGKISPVPTLFITSLPEDEQRLSMGEEVGTMSF
jgi:hypothetical protein